MSVLCGWGQSYVRLADASGDNSIPSNLSILTESSNQLKDVFPVEYRDSIFIYDFGCYIHSSYMTGENEIDNLMAQAHSLAASQSKYYMLFFRAVLQDGNTKNKLSVQLPSDVFPNCSNQAKFETLRLFYEEMFINSKENAFNNENKILKELKNVFDEFRKGNCCPISKEQILKKLSSLDFVPFATGAITKDETPSSAFDFGKCKFNGINIVSQVTSALQSLPNPKNIILTDDDNICLDNKFDEAKAQYESNMNAFDVWVHIHKASDSEYIWFMRFEQNVEFDGISHGLKDIEIDARSNKRYIRYENENSKVSIIDSKILSNRNGEGDDDGYTDPWADPCPVHIVKSANETFATIVTLYEYDFFYADLVRWNPSANPNNLAVGQKILLCLEECEVEKLTFSNETTFPFDPSFGSYNWKHSNSEIRKQMGDLGWSKESQDFYIQQRAKMTGVPVSKKFVGFVFVSPFSQQALNQVLGDQVAKSVAAHSLEARLARFINSPVIKTIGKGMSIVSLVCLDAGVGNHLPLSFNDRVQAKKSAQMEALDIDEKRLKQIIIYVTYTKFHPTKQHNPDLKPGLIYAGRSRGVGMLPCEIVARRDGQHTLLRGEGFQSAILDHAEIATISIARRHADPSYQIIRGRENHIIKQMGGRWVIGSKPKNIETRSRNMIMGIDARLPHAVAWENMASHILPKIPKYIWDGPPNDICKP